METRKIGSLDVSVVGLGCNNFGGRLDIDGTQQVVDAALDAGINFLDTADIYGGTKSEQFLGEVLKGRRDKVILATKFGMKIDDERQGARPEYLKRAAEDSLKRLETDHFDLYQLHAPDETVPIADTLGALNDLVQAGKVREIGCSNFSPEQLRDAEAAVKAGDARFVSVQNEYSLLKRDPEEGVLDACKALGIAFIPYFPLASGLLSGKYRKDQPLPQGTRIGPDSRWLTDANLDTVEELIAFSSNQGHTILELAISWLLSRDTVASVIAGATKVEQVRANATAARWTLSEAELAQVDKILAGAVNA